MQATHHTPIADIVKPTTMPGTGATIVATANLRDKAGQYPAFVAMAHDQLRVDVYSTHVVYQVDEAEPPVWAATNGHYEMSEDEARKDFVERWQQGY